jgi:hypothetical protein
MIGSNLFPHFAQKKGRGQSEKIRDIISSQRFSPRSTISHDASGTGDPTSG